MSEEKRKVESDGEKATQRAMKSWRKRTFITVWVTYMAFYLGRVNIGIAKPFMMAEFGIDPATFGIIGTALFIMYAIGQFVNGQLGDKFGARRVVAIGLIVSAIINILMGFSFGILVILIILWGINGYFQSMGWAPSVKTVANWYPPDQRGKRSGHLATSYLTGGAVSWILATFLITTLGLDWRFSFWVPGIIMLAMGVHWYIRVRNAPEEVGLPTIEEQCDGIMEMGDCREDSHLGFKYTISTIMKNRTVLFAAFGLFCLNIIRYGIAEWLPYILHSEVTSGDFFPLWKTIAFPLGGIIGALFCTWFSDKFLGKRRIPIICAFFLMLALSLFVYTLIPPLNWIIGAPLLVLIGFFTFGPHVLLVSTIPMEFATRKAASSATGFIDGWGYVGSAVTTFLSGVLIGDAGPESAFLFWIITALAGGLVLIAVWNSLPEKKEYL
jgi:OPA family glycerol-3-phosphate transporter-like MFS transporter